MKKLLSSICILRIGMSCFALDFSEEVAKAVNKIIPAKDIVIQVETPTYSETDTASQFSVYLKEVIEIALSDAGKELFNLDADRQSELFLSELKDSGVYEIDAEKWVQRKFPAGVLASTFMRQGDKVQVFFSYKQFAGNTKKSSVTFSAGSLRNMKYEPDNYELAKEIAADFSKIDETASTSSSFLITAAMLDEHNNLVDILHPNDTVRFMISTEKDAYIALLCIDANGDKNWLPVQDNFIRAGEVKVFPDIAGQVYKVVDGVYGAEQILVYASTSPAGLPAQDSGGTYNRGDIQHISRGIMAVKEQSAEQYETNIFKITYTVMP
ncbi:MAG: DUF4384 domain-containing protein [Treponema sp.]|nr:DUF4384 domain-containing protein [Treponema sp.]